MTRDEAKARLTVLEQLGPKLAPFSPRMEVVYPSIGRAQCDLLRELVEEEVSRCAEVLSRVPTELPSDISSDRCGVQDGTVYVCTLPKDHEGPHGWER